LNAFILFLNVFKIWHYHSSVLELEQPRSCFLAQGIVNERIVNFCSFCIIQHLRNELKLVSQLFVLYLSVTCFCARSNVNSDTEMKSMLGVLFKGRQHQVHQILMLTTVEE